VAPFAVSALMPKHFPNLNKKRDGFLWFNMFFVCTGVVCILMSIIILILDAKNGSKMRQKAIKSESEKDAENLTKKSMTRKSFR
jgi:hypothetical protein